MEEDEEMYRLMNEEDPWYMGPKSSDNHKTKKKTPPEKKKSK